MEDAQTGLLEYVWFAASGAALLWWLGRTRGGRRIAWAAYHHSRLRAVDMLMLGLAFLVIIGLAGLVIGPDPSRPLYYVVNIQGQLLLIAIMLAIGRRWFIGGWTGWGLTGSNVGSAALWGVGYFAVGTGLTLLVLAVTQRLSAAAGYSEVQQHTFLEILAASDDARIKALLIISAGLLTPVVEELLFRGFLQTFLMRVFCEPVEAWSGSGLARRAQGSGPDAAPSGDEQTLRFTTGRRWGAIALTALVFAAMHNIDTWQQWPALAVLGLVLGYAYERTGSLWTPIIMHALFNLLMLIATLTFG